MNGGKSIIANARGAGEGTLLTGRVTRPDAKDNVYVVHGRTVLDRVHQSMLLFAAGRSNALKRFLVDEGIGKDERFWRLAQALSALYPSHTDEKRWVDGVLARKKGLGFEWSIVNCELSMVNERKAEVSNGREAFVFLRVTGAAP